MSTPPSCKMKVAFKDGRVAFYETGPEMAEVYRQMADVETVDVLDSAESLDDLAVRLHPKGKDIENGMARFRGKLPPLELDEENSVRDEAGRIIARRFRAPREPVPAPKKV